MTNSQELQGWIGRTLVDNDRDKVGKVEDIYMDDDTGKPEWLAVSTGFFGNRISFVPIAGATTAGNDLRSPWTKAQVKDAPHAEPDGQLTQEEEARLYRHYGLEYSERRSTSGLPEGAQTGAPPKGKQGSTDKSMTRSEEELRVGKTSEEAGKVRLRKWVETEHVSKTVPLTHEEVRVEREPITQDNRGRATAGAQISEGELEVTLHEEQVVAETRAVPKERVKLEKDVVTEDETVDADLRKERIEVEGDQASKRPPKRP